MYDSFPEPRGWALEWEGTALFPPADGAPRDRDASEAESTGWALQWRRVAGASQSLYTNGNGANGLSSPLGWALKWDGSALAGLADPNSTASLLPVEREREDAV